jgi:LacI family transcriptional regulator
MENQKDVTIYDIAKTLHLSPSTVSKALKDDPKISKKTRKRIFETAAVMGYRSNFFARNLRHRQSLTIGVMVHDLNNPFMTSVLSGVEKIANQAGCGIIITDSSLSANKEAANAQILFNRRVDGVIASLAPDTKSFDVFQPFVEKNIPIIFVDMAPPVQASISVTVDNVKCGNMATLHLIEQGCTRIAHLTSNLQSGPDALRYKGYLEALSQAGIPFHKELLLIAEPTEDAAAEAAQKIIQLNPLPDGLFVTSDFMAAICIRIFLEHRIKVPRDIAVVGFNNDVIGRLISPTLSTVNYPGMEMGQAAASALLNDLKGISKIGGISMLTMRGELIVRESSLKKR